MSLPTPPSTSHHRDNENRLPGSRVAWAQQNQYFIFPHSPKGSVPNPVRTYTDQPAKSILKKRDNALLSVPEEDQREITPEPENPLVDLAYLSRPVEQIIAPDPTLRDLIEAYSILHARLRAAVTGSTDADASWPLFQPLRENTQAFTGAVVRDLGRALVEPKSDVVEDDDLPMGCDNDGEEGETLSLLPSPKQSPKKKKKLGMSASQIKFARDLCTTTHSVLRLLSAVFTVPALYQIFTDDQLCDMLTRVLTIPMADELPTPNARKTCALSIWLIQVQRLPEDILLPARDRIAFALRRGMEGELGKEGKKGSACDALKAVHDLSLYQPSTFIPAFAELLPSILANLLAPTLALRAQACHALGGFVLGCTALPPSYLHTRISNAVSTFLTTPATPSPRQSPTKTSADPVIIRTLRTTLNAVDPQYVAQGPVWALSVLACLIVLLGPTVCTDVRHTRTVSALLSLAMRNKKSSVRALACLLWRCVTWAYLRPPLKRSSEGDGDFEDVAEEQDMQLARENFWKVVKSVIDMGAGVSTTAALLGDDCDDEDRLRKALGLVKAMIKKGGQTCADGMDIAKILVSSENSGESWSLNNLLPHSLFSSNPGLLSAEYKTLSSAVRPIFEECPQLSDIRSLTREVLSRDWVFKELIDIWRSALSYLQMSDDCATPPELVATWEGLMKANVAVLLDADDHDGIVDFAAQATGILAQILRDPQLELTLKVGPPSSKGGASPVSSRSIQLAKKIGHSPSTRSNAAMKLFVVRELWASMRTTFPNNLLHAGGAKLVECLVEDESDLVWETDTPDDARKEWAKLSAETLVICDIDELRKFWERRSRSYAMMSYEPGVQSLVWGCFIEAWKVDTEGSWEGATILLGIPFDKGGAWELSNDEFGAWDAFLKHAMNKADDNGVDEISVLDRVAEQVARSPCPAFASSTRVADLILSHCEMGDARQFPSNVFDFVNDTLLSTYPPEPRNLKPCMWLIASLTRVVDACPVDFRLNLLEMIQDGVSIWLSDEYRVFTQEEYALDVLPLYQTALLGVQELPRNLTVLEVLSPLLQCVFIGRDDKPNITKEAFVDFWTATFADYDEPEGGWPEDLQVCLRCCISPTEEVPGVEPDVELFQDVREADDSTVYASSSEDTATEVLCSSPPRSLLSPESGSLCSERIVRTSRHQAVTSPFVGKLAPALFPPLVDLRQSVGDHSRSPSQPTNRTSTEPSTPIKRTFRALTPPRPQKLITTPRSFQSLLLQPPAGTLPIHPTTPTTPRRSPVKVGSSVSPHKRRKLGDKENVSPLSVMSVMERICSRSPSTSESPSVLGKRQALDKSPHEDGLEKGRTSSMSFIRSSVAFPSLGDSDLEDELAVEESLFTPTGDVRAHHQQSVVPSESSQSSTSSRKRKRQRIIMDAVVVPSMAYVRRQKAMQRRVSADHANTNTTPLLRRTLSLPMLNDSDSDESMELRRKRLKCWDGVDLGEVASSSPSLRALAEIVIAGSDDSIMLIANESDAGKSTLEGSDDDPHLGQVSPRHLVSPAPRRHMDPDYDLQSDDMLSSSPSRDLVARRHQRFGIIAGTRFSR
ncbi:hypothetical protein PAXRUDRAFT_829068 [Paxillus rubicundulus Ve08.2h10]|uniref:Telomere-associated protein Rif1 N-terminal domain-containing protein n=1 Tax=Paxillus rubicundulus Ve08.2h10 TaxID=930991 RepID=A0A0D0DNC9_9AGAM|nr:hypothetical protein PAXRUDRAFT_829068 [Paxillus rubicundulus Ve08.2h10]